MLRVCLIGLAEAHALHTEITTNMGLLEYDQNGVIAENRIRHPEPRFL